MTKRAEIKKIFPKENLKNKEFEPVLLEPLQVTIGQTNGDYNKLVKRFIKKVRNEEVLKPYYNKIAYFISKSEKKREKLRKAKFQEKKRRLSEENS